MPLQTLIEFGLSEKQATIYLALLSLGAAGATQIAESTRINRSSVYVALKSLLDKGFVTSTPVTNPHNEVTVLEFAAASPDAFLKVAKDRSRQLQALHANIQTLVPELKALHKDTRHTPKVYVYQGAQALEYPPVLLEEQMTRGMKTCRFYGLDKALLKADKAGLKLHAILARTPRDRAGAARNQGGGGISGRFMAIPPEKFNRFPHELPALAIYEDKITFFSKEPVLVVIENKPFADVLKNLFDLAFKERRQ